MMTALLRTKIIISSKSYKNINALDLKSDRTKIRSSQQTEKIGVNRVSLRGSSRGILSCSFRAETKNLKALINHHVKTSKTPKVANFGRALSGTSQTCQCRLAKFLLLRIKLQDVSVDCCAGETNRSSVI
jgi:hypothetical protein